MNNILLRVYALSAIFISIMMFCLCLLLNWTMQTTVYSIMASLLISTPALVIVNAFWWLIKNITMSLSFVWILMLSCIPLMVAIPAFVLADNLPGDAVFLMVLGMLSCYVGILSHAGSIAVLFKSIDEAGN